MFQRIKGGYPQELTTPQPWARPRSLAARSRLPSRLTHPKPPTIAPDSPVLSKCAGPGDPWPPGGPECSPNHAHLGGTRPWPPGGPERSPNHAHLGGMRPWPPGGPERSPNHAHLGGTRPWPPGGPERSPNHAHLGGMRPWPG